MVTIRRMSLGILASLTLVGIVGAVYVALGDADMDAAPDAAGHTGLGAVVGVAETGVERTEPTPAQWCEHLESGNPLRVLYKSRTTEVIPLEPPLEASVKKKLAADFAMILTFHAGESDPKADSETSAWQLLQWKSRACQPERARAVLDALEKDRYVIVEKGKAAPKTIPDGVVVFGNSVVHKGLQADVHFLLRFEDYPALGAAYRDVRAAADFYESDYCYQFNSLPDADRRARIEGHLAVSKELLRIKATMATLDPAAAAAATREWSAHSRDPRRFPSFVVVDVERAILSVGTRR
jgi:hypothetical protein